MICFCVQGSGLPSLLQSKLTAPRILLIYKVATYCQSKLAEQSYHMQLGTVYWDQQKQQVNLLTKPSSFLVCTQDIL